MCSCFIFIYQSIPLSYNLFKIFQIKKIKHHLNLFYKNVIAFRWDLTIIKKIAENFKKEFVGEPPSVNVL